MSATKAGKRPLRSLTAHEKLNAIKRVSAGGESKASVARAIGVPESTLRGWCKNEEKISYQVRTSPSNLEDTSPENINLLPAKRLKQIEDQPYNLSMKTSDVSNGSYSPNSESNFEGEYSKSSQGDSVTSPLNLRAVKVEPAAAAASIPKVTNTNIEKDKEREKNRAELARLSAELGLNRPEVLMSTLNNNSNLTDLTTVLLQWKSVYQTWFYQQQQKALLQNKTNIKVTSPTDVNGTNKLTSPSNNGLLTTVDKRDKMLNNVEQQPSVYDSVSYWLRQQSLLGLNNNAQQSVMSCLPSTSTITSGSNTTTATEANISSQNMLWNWYQQSAYNVAQMQSATKVATTVPQQQVSPSSQQQQQQRDNQQILYQQLTKAPSSEKEIVNNCENELTSETTKDEKPKNLNINNNKCRSVLDNLLLNNNTIETTPKKDDADALDAHEAIEHGEKFLNWLEHCSDPSVTTLQLHTVQSLIKNLKNGFDRKVCQQNRNKVKRK